MKTNEKIGGRKATQAQNKSGKEHENVIQQNGNCFQLQLAVRRPFVVGPAREAHFSTIVNAIAATAAFLMPSQNTYICKPVSP